MISRIAEQSYWMFRYLERSEILVQSLFTFHLFTLDNHSFTPQGKALLLLPTGARALFESLYPEEHHNKEALHHFSIWNKDNPNSLLHCIRQGRENGRMIRNTIGESLWGEINDLYLWLALRNVKNLYANNRYAFYTRLLRSFQVIKGFFRSFLLRDEYFHMMKIGSSMERAYQAARTYQYLERFDNNFGEEQQCRSLIKFILECNTSVECYLNRHYTFSSDEIQKFFLDDPVSPRSLHYNVTKICHSLSSIASSEGKASALFSKNSIEITHQILLLLKERQQKHVSNEIFAAIYEINKSIESSLYPKGSICITC